MKVPCPTGCPVESLTPGYFSLREVVGYRQADNVVAGVYVMDFAGDAGAEVRAEVGCCVTHVLESDVAAEGGDLAKARVEALEAGDAGGGEGADGARGDGVHADVFVVGAEVAGQVADAGLEGGLGDPHHVVVRKRPQRAEVRQREDRAALAHDGKSRSCESC